MSHHSLSSGKVGLQCMLQILLCFYYMRVWWTPEKMHHMILGHHPCTVQRKLQLFSRKKRWNISQTDPPECRNVFKIMAVFSQNDQKGYSWNSQMSDQKTWLKIYIICRKSETSFGWIDRTGSRVPDLCVCREEMQETLQEEFNQDATENHIWDGLLHEWGKNSLQWKHTNWGNVRFISASLLSTLFLLISSSRIIESLCCKIFYHLEGNVLCALHSFLDFLSAASWQWKQQ